jgi:hypothetical protein
MSKNTTTRAPRKAKLSVATQEVFGIVLNAEMYDDLANQVMKVHGITRATIYGAIIGIAPDAKGVFSTSQDPSVKAMRSSVYGIITLCGQTLTPAQRSELAEQSLSWHSMSHGQALALIRRASVKLCDKDGKEVTKLTPKAVATVVKSHKAEKDAKKADKTANAPKVEPAVPEVAVTHKQRVSVAVAALMTELNSATLNPKAKLGELSLLVNVLNQYVEAVTD